MQINYRDIKTKSSSCDFFRDFKIIGVIAALILFCVFILPIVFAILKNLWWILPLIIIAFFVRYSPLPMSKIRYYDGTCQWPNKKNKKHY